MLENLSFKVTKDYEITIDMFKNRKNAKERKVARFQVSFTYRKFRNILYGGIMGQK